MAASGFIKLFRQMTEWEWYQDVPVTKLFLHLLLIANYEDKRWKGIVVQRGQVSVSLAFLAMGSGLSVQQVRTALSKLESTGEITKRATNGFTLITICKYVDYQFIDNTYQQTDNKQIANEQQTDNIQTTIQKQTDNTQITTTKEIKNIRNNSMCVKGEPKNFFEIANNDEAWLEVMCMQTNTKTIAEIRDYLTRFNLHCLAGEAKHTDVTEYKSHFRDWMRHRIEEKTKNNGKTIGRNADRGEFEPKAGTDYTASF